MENNTAKLGDLVSLIKYPSLTEKSMNLYTSRQYTFFVDRRLTKTQLKYVFEKIFAVTIVGINTWNPPVKSRRVGRSVGNRSRYKKVSIKLKEGETLTDLVN